MELLIKHLISLESWNFVSKSRFLNNYKSKNKFKEALIHFKLHKILILCNELLISESGKPNYKNIDILEMNRFSVGSGEVDSFGWLTGIVETDKGNILFG
jgi:hypothetical protein